MKFGGKTHERESHDPSPSDDEGSWDDDHVRVGITCDPENGNWTWPGMSRPSPISYLLMLWNPRGFHSLTRSPEHANPRLETAAAGGCGCSFEGRQDDARRLDSDERRLSLSSSAPPPPPFHHTRTIGMLSTSEAPRVPLNRLHPSHRNTIPTKSPIYLLFGLPP